MKDIIITSKRIKTELYTLLISFIIANGFNLYAIIVYKTKYIELITQIGYVLIFTFALYFVWTVIRLLYLGAKKIIKIK
ncbi:hypothetical protein MASR2M117_15960 [Paludibacter sp.]